MKNINLAICAIFLILFQSCTVYHYNSIPLQKAIGKGAVVVSDNSGNELFFKDIEYTDDNYYGVMKGNGYLLQIDSSSVTSVRLKNIPKSQNRTLALISGMIAVIPALVFYYGWTLR